MEFIHTTSRPIQRLAINDGLLLSTDTQPFTLPTAIWDAHVAAGVPHRNSKIVLSERQYSRVGSIDDEAEVCPICQENLADKLKDTKEDGNEEDADIIRLNCGGDHIGCKKCLQQAYEFQQTCPLCKRDIKYAEPVKQMPSLVIDEEAIAAHEKEYGPGL
jgi:hypothetical protein